MNPARQTKGAEQDLLIIIARNQSRAVCKTQNEHLIIAICKRAGLGMGRKICKGGGTCSHLYVTLLIDDLEGP
jgi:hypothetical protein